jgi:hypothetical protein
MSVDVESYAGQVARLDVSYIRVAGEAIRSRLFPAPREDGQVPVALPVGLSFQPDNGTAYSLCFIPVEGIQQASAEVNEPNGAWSVPAGCYRSDGSVIPGSVLVVKANGAYDWAYVFDLSFGALHFWDYVAQHTGSNVADGSALTALFRAISGVEIEDR